MIKSSICLILIFNSLFDIGISVKPPKIQGTSTSTLDASFGKIKKINLVINIYSWNNRKTIGKILYKSIFGK